MKGQKNNKLQTKESDNVRDIIPISDIKDGILITDNSYIAFIEIMPINFKLRSEREQKYIVNRYEELLKIMKVPFSIFTISKKADLKEHLEFVQKNIETEENEAVKEMAKEYQEFVSEIARKNTVKRRFIVAIPYQSIKDVPFYEVKSWLEQMCIKFRDAIKECGNEVLISDNDQFTAEILFELLNIKSSERGRIPVL